MKILCVSLGCDKNLVDTENMLGLLSNDGYEFTDDEAEAEIIIINTCCFINDAKEESVNTILEMAEYKKTGQCKALVVTGCLAQRYKTEITEEIPEVDACVGTSSWDEICRILESALAGKQEMCFRDLDRMPDWKAGRIGGSCIRYLLCPDGGRGDSQVCEGAESGNKDNAAKACKEPTDRGHMHRPGTQADQGYIQ